MVMTPLLGATSLNCSTTALYSPPAVAKMSKLVSTCVPSIRTLKVREPAVRSDAAGARGDLAELLHHRLVLSAGGGEDVEVGQHLRPVDQDVEGPRARRRPVLLGEMQSDRVGSAGDGAGDRVGEIA